MTFAKAYLGKHKVEKRIPAPHPQLQMGIVIPCYREHALKATIESLYSAYQLYKKPLLVVVVINSSERDGKEVKTFNRHTLAQLIETAKVYSPDFRVFPVLEEELRHKHAGAGFARKIGMDLLVAAFDEIQQPAGIIVSMDADTLVAEDFLVKLNDAYYNNPELGVATHGFAHPLDLPEYTPAHRKAIVAYELHMRYYKHALASAGFPFAFYTVGSAFSCRAQVYAAQGGMNRRKAGEDFYFLHKLFPVTQSAELPEVTVFPSARLSDRVPFGTGPQLAQLVESDEGMLTYSLEAFSQIGLFLDGINRYYKGEEMQKAYELIPADLHPFFLAHEFSLALEQMHKHSASFIAFRKRFFRWFDAFRCLKLLNYLHNEGLYKKQPIGMEASKFIKKEWGEQFAVDELEEQLIFYRQKDGVD